MRSRSTNMSDEGIIEAAFKRTDGGWIYKAPSPWLVGPAPHYVVNDAQRAAIARRLRTNRATNVIVIAIVLFILGFMVGRMPESTLAVAWYVAAPVLIVLVGLGRYLAIRPLVAGLPQSSDRITFSDQARTGAAHMSLTHSVIFFALFAALALFQPFASLVLTQAGSTFDQPSTPLMSFPLPSCQLLSQCWQSASQCRSSPN
jgi:hypothetical protein